MTDSGVELRALRTRLGRTRVVLAAGAAPWILGVGIWTWVAPPAVAKVLHAFGPPAMALAAYGLCLAIGIAVVLGRTMRALPRNLDGRTLLGIFRGIALLSTLTTAAVLAVVALGARAEDETTRMIFGAEWLVPWLQRVSATPGTVLITLSDAGRNALSALVVLDMALRVAWAGFALSLWFMIDAKVRERIILVVDGLLLVGTVAAVALLPNSPRADSPGSLQLAVTRLVVETLFGVRVVLRSLPWVLSFVETLNFQSLLAARHLRSRSSKFITAMGAMLLLAVSLGSCSLSTTLSVMGGFRSDLQRKILGYSAHIVVDKGEDGELTNWPAGLAAIRATPGVLGATPFVTGEVMVSGSSNLAGAVLTGIDPGSIGQVNELGKNMKRGGLKYLVHPEGLLSMAGDTLKPLSNTSTNTDDLEAALRDAENPKNAEVLPGVIVGQELARSLRLYVGDEVNLVSPLGGLGPTGPVPKSRPFRIAGIFYSGMYEYDMKRIYVDLGVGQRFLNTGNAVHGIDIKTTNVDRAPEIAKTLRSKLGPEFRVEDWQTRNKNLFGALALERIAMFIALGLAILVAGFCVFGVLTLLVEQKRREVGVILSLGATGSDIIRLFMTEGFLIGVFGASMGLGFAFIVCFTAKNIGIPMNSEVYYMDKLPVHMDPWDFAAVGICAVLTAMIATVVPAIIASRTRPVDAIKFG